MPSSKKQAKRERKIQAHPLPRMLLDFDERLKCKIDLSILHEAREVVHFNGLEHTVPHAFHGALPLPFRNGGVSFMKTMYKLALISDDSLHSGKFKFTMDDLIDICGANTLRGNNGLAAVYHYSDALLDSRRSEDQVVEQMELLRTNLTERCDLDRAWESKLSQHPRSQKFFVPEVTINNLLRGESIGWIPDTLEAWSPLQRGMRRLKGSYGRFPIEIMKLITCSDIELTLAMLLRNAAAHVDAIRRFVRNERTGACESAKSDAQLMSKLITHRRELNLQLFDLEARLNSIDGRLQLTSQIQSFEAFTWIEKTSLLRDTGEKHKGWQERVCGMKVELKRMMDRYFQNDAYYTILQYAGSILKDDPADIGCNDVRVDTLPVYEQPCCQCGRWDCCIFSALQGGREVYDDVDTVSCAITI